LYSAVGITADKQDFSSWFKLKFTLKYTENSTIIVSVILYGCETCYLTLREVENSVLKRIFGRKSMEATRGWKKTV